MKFDCKNCGACCKPGWMGTSVYLNDSEIEEAAKLLDIRPNQLKEHFMIFNNHISVTHNACTFLDENNRCIIHDAKPTGCKRWPWINFNNKKTNQKRSAAVCPGITIEG